MTRPNGSTWQPDLFNGRGIERREGMDRTDELKQARQEMRDTGSSDLFDAQAPTTDNGRRIRDFHLVDGRSWARSQQTSDGGYESIFVANRHDTTRVYLGYESRCGWCWLGAGHSEAAHNQRTV